MIIQTDDSRNKALYKNKYMEGVMDTEKAQQVKKTIRKFILDSINISDLDDNDNIFESGIVNSLFAVQLMTFLEKSFNIEVTMDDLDIENFQSINATASFILRKNGSS